MAARHLAMPNPTPKPSCVRSGVEPPPVRGASARDTWSMPQADGGVGPQNLFGSSKTGPKPRIPIGKVGGNNKLISQNDYHTLDKQKSLCVFSFFAQGCV